MAETITLLLLGIGSGSLLALSALGLVLMYRSSGVVNFSTGAVGMACSFVMWDLTRNAGWSTWPAGLVSVLFGALLGVISYVLVMVLPRRNSNLTRVIGTLAILVILEAAAQLRYGTDSESVNSYLPSGSVNLGGGIVIPSSQILLAAVALVLTVILGQIYARTTFGLATTAVSERPRTLAALGWRIWAVGSINWAIGGALSGLAGVLLAPVIGVSITNGNVLTVAVLAAALIGGMRSFTLTLVGGVVIGMLQSLFSIHDLGIPGLADAIPFVAIIGVIAIRGRKLPLRSFIGERLPRVGTGELRPGAILAGLALVVVMVGFVLNANGVAGAYDHDAHSNFAALADRAAGLRGTDVTRSVHTRRRWRSNRGPTGGQRRLPVPAGSPAGRARDDPGRPYCRAPVGTHPRRESRHRHARPGGGDSVARLQQ